MAGIILSISVLATGSIVQSAYAGLSGSSITNWTVTLTNENSGKSFEWTEAGTGLGSCDGAGSSCVIDLNPGQLRKCINSSASAIGFFSGFTTGNGPDPIQCKGPWEVSISGDFVCFETKCTVFLAGF